MSLIRLISAALLWLLLTSTVSQAGDYSVAWAFDAGDMNERGIKADCTYEDYCTIKPEKFAFDVTLKFRHPGYRIATINISRVLNCCYFAEGESSVERDADPLIRLTVFEGRARRGNEFVLNVPVGSLYLQFSNLK